MVDEPTYSNLAEYLAHLADLADATGGLVDPSELIPLALEVNLPAVRALLLARLPDILEHDNAERFPLYLELLNGVALEVTSIVGSDPQEPRRALAVHAIAVGVAADIEASMFPEQQDRDGAAAGLRARYLALLKQLRAGVGSDPGDGSLADTGPRGSFPPPLPPIDYGPGTSYPHVPRYVITGWPL